MTPMENLRKQMEMFRELRRRAIPEDWPYPYVSIEDILLRKGRVFERSPAAPPIRPVPKACFANAYRLTQRKNSRWVYCEGFATSSIGLAVHHAWVMRPDAPGEAVDLAWEDTTKSAYIGLPFSREFVRQMHVASKRRLFSVLDGYWCGHPLLTGERKLEEVIWKGEN